MTYTHSINVNINPNGTLVEQNTFEAMQGDVNVHVLNINLKDNGSAYTIKQGIKARIMSKKSDGHQLIYDCDIEDNVITITLPDQYFTCFGKVKNVISLTDSENNEVLTSLPFYFYVIENFFKPYAVYSSDNYTALTDAILEIDSAIDEAEDAATEATIAAQEAKDAASSALNPITTDRITNAAVTTDKLASTCVTEAKLANSSVTNGKIADNAVTASKINGLSASISELNYCDGVTGNIQSQLDSKLGLVSTATAGNIAVFNSSGNIEDSLLNSSSFASSTHNHNCLKDSTGNYDLLAPSLSSNKTIAVTTDIPQRLIFQNLNVAVASWASDSTYTGYAYKADIVCSGVSSSMYGEVTFDCLEASSGNFAPVCSTSSNCVTIYSKTIPDASITIPLIMVVQI